MQEIGHSWKRNRLSNLNLNETNLKKPHSPVSNNGGEQGLPNQRYLPGHSSAGRTVTAAAVCVRCGLRFHEHQLAAAQAASVLARPLGRSWLYPGIPDPRAGRMRVPGPRLPLQVRVRVRRRTAGAPRARSDSESTLVYLSFPCQCQSDCQRGREADSTAGRFHSGPRSVAATS